MASLSPISHQSSSSYPSFNHFMPFHTPNTPTHNFIPPTNPSFAAAAANNNNVLALPRAGIISTTNNSLAQQENGAGDEFHAVNNNNNVTVAGGGNSGGNWKVNLPLGVRFRPTDIELINYYLRPYSVNPSLFNQDHPITHANIYDYDPHQLLGLGHDHGDGKRYFYTRVKKIGPSKTNRSIKSKKGSWKPTQKPKKVEDLNTNNIIGYKRPLAFYDEANNKTQWLMQEYMLETRPPEASSDELVLAVVYYYRRRKRDDDNDN